MKKVVVLGASGFVGKHLQLDENKYEITLCSSKDCDITDEKDLSKTLKKKDIVINLVAPNTQIDSPGAEKINQEVIVEGTKNLIHAAKDNKIKKIIHLSSIAGYRKNRGPYGDAKRQSDELLLVSGLNVTILKPTLIYGKGGFIFEKLLKSITKIPFIVPVIGNGRNLIQPAFVGDVAKCIDAAIGKDARGVHTYDIGGPHTIKFDNFIKEILKTLGKKKLPIHIPLTPLLIITKLLGLFSKKCQYLNISLKRMTEQIKLDVHKTEKELGVETTPYCEGLKQSIG